MLRFWVGTVPLPSESPLGITPGSGAAGAQSRPGSGRMLEAVGRSSGCGDCAQFGRLPCPLQGSVWAGQHLGRSNATLVGFGFNPMSADWAQGDPGVCLGAGVCVLGHLLLLTLQMLSSVWWCGLDIGTAQTAFPLGVTKQHIMFCCGRRSSVSK